MGEVKKPGKMPPVSVMMDERGRMPDGRMVVSPEVVLALRRLRNWNKHGIQLPGRSLEELVEALFDALWESQGIEFEVKT